MLLLIKDQRQFCGPDLQALPSALFSAPILFPHIADRMMVLFYLSVFTPSQSSSIIPPAFLTYITEDFGGFVYWCFISVVLNEGIPEVLENSFSIV
jgi:hypothetical protein